MSKKQAVGWIPFWNLHPFRKELESKIGPDFLAFTGKPTEVNRALQKGNVVLAPSSSICLLTNTEARMALPLGVAARGKVRSVYWGVNTDREKILAYVTEKTKKLSSLYQECSESMQGDLRSTATLFWSRLKQLPTDWAGSPPTIHLTQASAASAMLSKVLYKMYFGESNFEKTFGKTALIKSQYHSRSDLELLIGDEALRMQGKFQCELDLSELWHSITNLPFVFAVWQTSQKSIDTATITALKTCAEIAERKMRVQPSTYLPQNSPQNFRGQSIDLAQYWSLLHYQLTVEDRKGLLLYLNLSKPLLPAELEKSSLTKLIRWQNQSVEPEYQLPH